MKIDLYRSRYFMPEGEAAGTATVSEETSGDVLAAQAYAELDGTSEPKKKEPEEAEAEPAEKQPAEGESEPQEKEGEGKPKEKEAPAEESAEEKAPEEEVAPEPIPDERIQAHAEKQGMTFIQAKDELEQAQALLVKYGNDPLELARAARNTQREYDKLKGAAIPEKQEEIPEILSDEQLKVQVDINAARNADKIVAHYRNAQPKRTALMDDEAILEWAKEDFIKDYKANSVGIIAKTKTDAITRRQALLEAIPREDARFVNEVKLVLENTPDRVILNPKYKIEGMVWYAKGKNYDVDIKAAYQRGLNAGKEQPKILGTTGGTGSGKQGAKIPSSTKTTLSVDQKQHAYDRYPDSSPAKAEEMWSDDFKEELKKNKNYLPY